MFSCRINTNGWYIIPASASVGNISSARNYKNKKRNKKSRNVFVKWLRFEKKFCEEKIITVSENHNVKHWVG